MHDPAQPRRLLFSSWRWNWRAAADHALDDGRPCVTSVLTTPPVRSRGWNVDCVGGGGGSPTHCPEELFLIAVSSFLWYNQDLFCVYYCYWPGIRDRSPHGFIVRYPETQESGVGKRRDTIVHYANCGFQRKYRISTSHLGVIPFFQPKPVQSWCFRGQDKLGIHISSSNLDHSWRPKGKWSCALLNTNMYT